MEYNRLKKVLSYIKETNSSYADPDGGYSLTDGSLAPFKVEDQEVFDKLNKFLRAFCTERHNDPKQALVLLRTKLNTVGLDFPYDGRRPLSPNEIFTVTQFGGRQGIDDNGQMFADDGISYRNDGKGLELHVETTPIDDNDQEKKHYMMVKMVYAGSGEKTVKDLEPPVGSAAASLKKK